MTTSMTCDGLLHSSRSTFPSGRRCMMPSAATCNMLRKFEEIETLGPSAPAKQRAR